MSSPQTTTDTLVAVTVDAPDSPFDAEDFRRDLQAVIDDFLDEQATRLAPLGEDAGRILAAARQAVTGGKRFRAAFCFWGFRAVSPTASADEERALLRACASLELLHASALVHDDYMDASDTRRGRPATHRAFEADHRAAGWVGDPEQYGAAAAILLGDLLLTWADELLRRSGFGWDRIGPAMEVFDICRSEVVAGQFLDVSVQARAKADVETAMTVLRYKSAKYSIERPLHIGAALAGGDTEALKLLTRIGLPLGEAFQLRDDQLGVFGDPTVTGKPAGDDLVEGKRTVLVALALDGLSPGQADVLHRSLGTSLTEDEVARLRAMIAESGAEQQVEAVIEELGRLSLAALESAPLREDAKQALRGLSAAATQRAL